MISGRPAYVLVVKTEHPRNTPIGGWAHDQIAGIFQPVFLEKRGISNTRDMQIIPDIGAASVTLQGELNLSPHQPIKSVHLRLKAPSGKIVYADDREAVEFFAATTKIPDMALWSPESPCLYSLTVSLEDSRGRVVDHATCEFGMRKVEAKNGRVLLNGKPVYLRGAQHYFQNSWTLHTAYPDRDKLLKREIALARDLGFNVIRVILQLADPRFYYWCDRLGMLAIAEPPHPNMTLDVIAAKDRAHFELWQETLTGMILCSRRHPSIIVWHLANESWGFFGHALGHAINPRDMRARFEHHAVLSGVYDYVKSQLDPTRLIIDDSGGQYEHGPALPHPKTDVHDYH